MHLWDGPVRPLYNAPLRRLQHESRILREVVPHDRPPRQIRDADPLIDRLKGAAGQRHQVLVQELVLEQVRSDCSHPELVQVLEGIELGCGAHVSNGKVRLPGQTTYLATFALPSVYAAPERQACDLRSQ